MYLIIICGAILLGVVCFWFGKQTVKPIEINNEKLIKEKRQLENDLLNIKRTNLQVILEQKNQLNQLQNQKKELVNQIADTENDIKVRTLSAESIAHAAFQNKCAELDIKFNKIEADYANKIMQFQEEETALKNELQSLKETRAAAIAAAQKEKTINENKDFYCLILPPEDQGDIEILKNIVKRISKPRSILMAIWQAYYQPLAKKKFPQILGKTDVCGIYKITNQQTGECYIGQSTDVRKRWYEHCRSGLGIDTPQNNKLYKAMMDYGLDVFSFELLLECPSNELNEKEKYFIELYSADINGYNGNKGVN